MSVTTAVDVAVGSALAVLAGRFGAGVLPWEAAGIVTGSSGGGFMRCLYELDPQDSLLHFYILGWEAGSGDSTVPTGSIMLSIVRPASWTTWPNNFTTENPIATKNWLTEGALSGLQGRDDRPWYLGQHLPASGASTVAITMDEIDGCSITTRLFGLRSPWPLPLSSDNIPIF